MSDSLVPRWATWVAVAVPISALPSTLWRLALGLGVPVGFHGDLARLYAAPGWITLYVFVLSAVAEAAALLTLGLVRPWGEMVPPWVPLVGARRVPVLAVVLPAVLGGAALTFMAVVIAGNWFGPDNNGDPDAPHGVAGLLMALSYAPMAAWGPLLLAVTAAYYVRRRRTGTPLWTCRAAQSSTSPLS